MILHAYSRYECNSVGKHTFSIRLSQQILRLIQVTISVGHGAGRTGQVRHNEQNKQKQHMCLQTCQQKEAQIHLQEHQDTNSQRILPTLGCQQLNIMLKVFYHPALNPLCKQSISTCSSNSLWRRSSNPACQVETRFTRHNGF